MSEWSNDFDPSIGAYRERLRRWLAENEVMLAPFRGLPFFEVEDRVRHELEFHRLLHDAGWSRYGWPLEFGGLGGSAVLRGVMYDELFGGNYQLPFMFETLETMGPMLEHFSPELAREHLPPFLAGDEAWSQGFSEPDSGSDLASLRTRAVDRGDHFLLSGQKIWTSYGQVAACSAVLARTGPPDSRHRGISMLWVDTDSPGFEVRPIRTASGSSELCEMFFDEVAVPKERLVGNLNGGWDVAMYMLQFERGMYAWQRQSRLHTRLASALAEAFDPSASLAGLVGEAYLQCFALRVKCRETVYRLAAGESPGPEISTDKVLLSTAEQGVLNTTRELLWPRLEVGGEDADERWRAEWWYSRATSIFGGAVEVQRDIIAERILGLPRSR